MGRGNFATTTPQTAKNGLKSSSKSDGRYRKRPVKQGPAAISILHIDIWYNGGQKGEINLTAPNMIDGCYLDEQYYFLRQYFRKVGEWMNLESYQASICFPRPDGTIKVLAVCEKVDFSVIEPFKPGQHCDCQRQKGGQSNV